MEAFDDAPVRERDAVSWFREFFPEHVADGDALVHFADCLLCGPENPLGLGLRTRVDGEDVVCEVTLGPGHEGAPDRAHGGIVAALFDDALGYLLTVHGVVAYTGELTVRYLDGVPVGVPVTFRSWIASKEGRRTMIDSEATVGDRVLATAHGVFVEPGAEHVAGIRAAVAASEAGAP